MEIGFQKYAVSEWTTRTIAAGKLESLLRKHFLTFLAFDLDSEMLSIVGAVNGDEFLGVAPDQLLCDGIFLKKVYREPEGGGLEAIAEAIRHPAWSLRYEFTEQASQRWNEVLQETEEGKAERRRYTLYPTIAMAAFFGSESFPLSEEKAS
jgi:hypothetical protein